MVLAFSDIICYNNVSWDYNVLEGNFMNERRKYVLISINLIFLVIFILSLCISVDRKAAKYSGTDISMYSNRASIPVIGGITDNRTAEMTFRLYDERLYGVSLFFYAEGENDDGDIICTLQYDGEEVDEAVIPVKELLLLMKGSSLEAKEIIFKTTPSYSGEYTLCLKGNGIDPGTRISLYGSRNQERYMRYINSGCQKYNEILYSIEILESNHPYVWATTLVLVMSLLFSYIICINSRERKLEVAE